MNTASETVAVLRDLGFEVKIFSGDDAVISLKRNGRTLRLRGQVKQSLRPQVVGLLAAGSRDAEGPRLLMADYVPPPIADALRNHGVQFVDTAGNAFLDSPYWHIFISGRPRQKSPRSEKTPRVFSRGGLATTFAILSAPQLVAEPLRSIAQAARVSLGTATNTLDGLHELGFVEEVRGKRRLFHRDRLIDQWTEAYARVLYPKLEVGRYTAAKADWWRRTAKLAEYGAQWGGETAAALLERRLVPSRTIVYADELPARLMTAARLRRDADGRVVIRRRFWNAVPSPRADVVPALLIYADLIVEGDSRSLAEAKEIRDSYLR